jgi:hypothetical protein
MMHWWQPPKFGSVPDWFENTTGSGASERMKNFYHGVEEE